MTEFNHGWTSEDEKEDHRRIRMLEALLERTLSMGQDRFPSHKQLHDEIRAALHPFTIGQPKRNDEQGV